MLLTLLAYACIGVVVAVFADRLGRGGDYYGSRGVTAIIAAMFWPFVVLAGLIVTFCVFFAVGYTVAEKTETINGK